MPTPRRNALVLGILLAVWGTVAAWQGAEHMRVRRTAWGMLSLRAKEISNTLGVIIRSQRRFGGVVGKEPMEAALRSLVKPGELHAIALLNEVGDIVASSVEDPGTSPPPSEPPPQPLLSSDRASSKPDSSPPLRVVLPSPAGAITFTNLVELGTTTSSDPGQTNPPIVLPRRNYFGTNRPFGPMPPGILGTNLPPGPGSDTPAGPPPPPNPGEMGTPGPGPDRGGREGRRGPRPPWMNEAEFRGLVQKQGVHAFAMVLSTGPVLAICRQDMLLRGLVIAMSGLGVAAAGVAWRNLSKSSELQIRLVRASEMNAHLKELNLAAAGLAHETRNPLNIIRGVAQLLNRQDELPQEARTRAREIIDEADRVTAQLNEFINYSRPREPHAQPVDLKVIVHEVLRALSYDVESKSLNVTVDGPDIQVLADEQMLRQAVFNLVLNATQAVAPSGSIEIAQSLTPTGEALLEIRDDGPGVSESDRNSIFKPYFTTHETGTGLGLAIVQKIILAHGWEIDCMPRNPRGAIFRITRMRVTTA